MRGIPGRLRRFVDKWMFNRDLEETEQEVLEVLVEGQGRAARSWRRVADHTESDEAEKKAREAALEQIRLTRMVNGISDLYSYGRGRDE